jgi:hypothetical protein
MREYVIRSSFEFQTEKRDEEEKEEGLQQALTYLGSRATF